MGSTLYFNRVQFGTGGPVPYEILFVGLKPASTVDDPGGSLRGVVCPPRSLTGGSFRWVEACLDRVQFGTGGPVPYKVLFVGLKPCLDRVQQRCLFFTSIDYLLVACFKRPIWRIRVFSFIYYSLIKYLSLCHRSIFAFIYSECISKSLSSLMT